MATSICTRACDCDNLARRITSELVAPGGRAGTESEPHEEGFLATVADLCGPVALEYASALPAAAAARQREADRMAPRDLASQLSRRFDELRSTLRQWARETASPRRFQAYRTLFGPAAPRIGHRVEELSIRAFVVSPFWALSLLASGSRPGPSCPVMRTDRMAA